MVSPDSQANLARRQAETPLIALFRFPEPALYGIAPDVIARASLIGQPVHQLSPLVAANYVLIGLAGVEFEAHQRFTLKWAFLLMFVMLIVAGILGVVPLLH
jgi:Mg2+/citrate symporter